MRTVAPETVGLASQRLSRIKRTMQAYVDNGELPGVVTVVARRGQIAQAECVGWMDIETDKPMQFDTIFRLRSMTKPISSVAVMMLYEQGHFQLYDPVSKFILEFKDMQVFSKATEAGMELCDLEREITIRDLLLHTSGLASGFGEDQPLAELYQGAELYSRDSTLQEFVRKLAKLPLLHQPGEAWRYGVSYGVLARLVEVVSDMPFADFLQQKIFDPLRMVDTGYSVPKDEMDRLATFYDPSETDGFRIIEAAHSSQLSTPPTLTPGGTGLVSTASDYIRFAQMLLNGGELDGIRLLGPRTVSWMKQNHLPKRLMPIRVGPDFGYNGHGFGLGFRVLTSAVEYEVMGSVGEYGWSGYAGTYFWVDPEEELIGLFMPQIAPLSYVPMWHAFRVLTYQAIVG